MAATTLTDRTLVRLSGEDVRGFLQGLVTSDVAGELPVWTGLLTPQGKCLFDFIVWADGEDLLLDCEADAADDLIRRLSIYRLRRPITIARDDTLSVHWSLEGDGPNDPRLPELGKRWIEPRSPAEAGAQTGEAVGALRATGPLPPQGNRWLEHRLCHGVCEGRAELGDVLWLECNAAELNGVSFTKGCFVGQENTARMNWRSKVNRRLVVVPTVENSAKTRAIYTEIGLSVQHLRVDALESALIPDWLAASLESSEPA